MAEAAIPRAVAQQAVEWMVELQSPDATPDLKNQWQQWRAADPVHEQAWQRIEAVNGRLGAMAGPDTLNFAKAALAPQRSARRRQMVKSLVVLVVAGGAAWTGYRQTSWREVLAGQRTGVGERRTIDLDDGTQVVMNASTVLDIRFGSSERRLRLIAGEILVQSGQAGGGRPLLVETPHGLATALGTRFSVRLDAEGPTRVGVYEGAVRLAPVDGQRSLVLQAGQKSSFDRQHIGEPRPAREDSDAAWVDGVLVARDMRLDDFLQELGRYSVHPLSCDDDVAALRLSGAYPLADIAKVLDNVAGLLSLQVQTVSRLWGWRAASYRLVRAEPKK